MLLKIRFKFIRWLAGDEPILLNWRINSNLVEGENTSAVYVPLRNDKYERSDLENKAVLTPNRNYKCITINH